MVLLRRIIGEALRERRRAQRRTLRDVSTAANVSLGYLSEIERGHKEASSELLSAICDALDTRLSEVLGEVSRTVAGAEDAERLERLREARRARVAPAVVRPADRVPATGSAAGPGPVPAAGSVSAAGRSEAGTVTPLRPRSGSTHPPQRRTRQHSTAEARAAA